MHGPLNVKRQTLNPWIIKKKHWICLYFKCHFLIYPRFGNKFKTHHIRYVINWKNSNWSCSIVLFILVTVCSASAVTSPRTDYVSIKPYHCETVSSVWVGLHIKCYFRPTQVRKIWTMMAKIPVMTFQENRSRQRRTMLCRGRDTTTLTVTFSKCFSMRFQIICRKILCYWVFLLETLVQRSGVTIRYRPDGPGIDPGGGEIFSTRPDGPWCPPSPLFKGYWVPFLAGSDDDHPTPLF